MGYHYFDKNVVRSLTALAIERTLLKLAPGELEIVIDRLESEYHSYIFDSFDHPEYLKETLEYIYPNEFYEIIDSIERELGDLSYQSPFSEFLEKMKKPFLLEKPIM